MTPRRERPHVGILVPPANGTAEPEIHELLGGRASCHTARFPVLPGLDLGERLRAYNASVTNVLAAFGDLRLEAVLLACTGCAYLHGVSEDREISERLADAVGAPITSAAAAILSRLEQLGRDEIVLASPYVPWLTDLARNYWREAAVRVAATIELRAGDRFAPYEVTTDEIVRAVRGAQLPGDTPILFSGTGMPTLDAIELLAAEAGRPLLSSNSCSARWLLERLPQDGAAHG
jgi:maleate isomerase